MDNNKLDRLKDISYHVSSCCGICQSSNIEDGKDFGTCYKFQYTHLKHKTVRDLSINRYGCCKDFKRKDMKGETQIFFNYLDVSNEGY